MLLISLFVKLIAAHQTWRVRASAGIADVQFFRVAFGVGFEQIRQFSDGDQVLLQINAGLFCLPRNSLIFKVFLS